MTGATLKRIRLAHGLTQAELGTALGVSYSSVNTWEKREGALPEHVEGRLRAAGLGAERRTLVGARGDVEPKR